MTDKNPKRRPISIGDGETVSVSYAEFKKRLRMAQKDESAIYRMCRTHFQPEYEQECAAHLLRLQQDREQQIFDGITTTVGRPYWKAHEDVLRSTISLSKSNYKNNSRLNSVSSFSKWIYAATHGLPRESQLQSGKYGELSVAKVKRDHPIRDHVGDWELISRDPLDGSGKPERITLLEVNEEPMYGLPDYVYRNTKTGAIRIVEVKFSPAEIPSDGWPNLRAQLWCYGQIDRLVEMTSDISLVGEIWYERTDPILQQRRPFRRHTMEWRINDPDFCKQNENLFEQYQKWAAKSSLR